MNQFTESFAKLTDSSDWPPRWHCGKWSDFHGWLYIVSDLLIWSAYFAIPLIILKYISKKKNAHFVKLYIFFASFILACGATHFLDAVMFGFPVYRISALVRLITGIISWVTVFNLIKLLPVAFTLRTTKELETEVEMRKKIEKDLQIQNERYNEAQTIAKMGHWNWDVKANEIVWSDNLFINIWLACNQRIDLR